MKAWLYYPPAAGTRTAQISFEGRGILVQTVSDNDGGSVPVGSLYNVYYLDSAYNPRVVSVTSEGGNTTAPISPPTDLVYTSPNDGQSRTAKRFQGSAVSQTDPNSTLLFQDTVTFEIDIPESEPATSLIEFGHQAFAEMTGGDGLIQSDQNRAISAGSQNIATWGVRWEPTAFFPKTCVAVFPTTGAASHPCGNPPIYWFRFQAQGLT